MAYLLTLLGGDPTVTFCEVPGSGLIARPWYLFSNLPYFLIGAYLIVAYPKSILSKIFGISAIAIGTFSSLYDITYTFGAQLLDLGGMFFFVLLLIALNIERLRSIGNLSRAWLHPLVVTTLSLLIMLGVFIFQGVFGNYAFAGLIVLVLITELRVYLKKKTANYKFWILGIALFLISSGMWMFDGLHIWCDPGFVLNGRSIFHYGTSIVVLLMFLFYRQFEKEQ